MIRGDSSVLVPYGLETKGLDVGTDEDVALLAELFMIHQTMEQVYRAKINLFSFQSNIFKAERIEELRKWRSSRYLHIHNLHDKGKSFVPILRGIHPHVSIPTGPGTKVWSGVGKGLSGNQACPINHPKGI